MHVHDLEKYLYNLKGKLNSDEGHVFGNGRMKVKGIQVSWMATLDAIQSAHKIGANVMLVHEALFFPYPFTEKSRPEDYFTWAVNRKRAHLLSEYGIAVVRFHGTLDEICIFDDFARALGLLKPSIEEEGLVKLYDIEPTSVEEMIERVKTSLGLDLVRVTPCDLKKKVRRIGLLWGGLGLFVNVEYQQQVLRHDPDLFIAGETDSYTMHFAIDVGVVVIETSHEISENIGLKNFTNKLKQELENIPIVFYENRKPWINR